MVEENRVFFSFGALSDDFSVQLKQQGYELKNKEKWDMAKEWCRKNGYKFKVITEDELRTDKSKP